MTLFEDFRYGLRVLRKNPGFTSIAVLTLALGIGANTAIFSLISALLLRPLPYKNPEKLVALDLTSSGRQNGQLQIFPWSYPMFQELRRDNRSFEAVAGFSNFDVNLTGTESPERLSCELVSASYFPLLGINPKFGRVFRSEEDLAPDAHPLVLVSDTLWRQKFAGDPAIVGRSIHLNQLRFTVIGVLPAGFKGQSGDIAVWVPISMAPSLGHMPKRLTNAMNFWVYVIGRLNPGISVAQASAQMQPLSREIQKAYPSPTMLSGWRVKSTPLAEAKTDPALRKSLLVLFGAVGFVLLIACVNMANLLMGRAVSRQKEVAVRLAIGAGRGALLRQFLTESVILGLLGGVAGLFLAMQAIDLLTTFHPEASGGFWTHYARTITPELIHIDMWVVGFNVLVSIVTGVLFGLLPAIQASRLDLSQALKDVSSGWAEGLRNLRRINSRSILIAGEMALALVLLAGAGLLLESFARLLATRVGAETDHILTAHVDLPPQKYSPVSAVKFDEQLLDVLRAVPAAQAVSISNTLPARGQTDVTVMEIRGGQGNEVVGVHSVDADYFRVFRVPLRRGRAFTDRDRTGAPKVLLLNETAARKLWPGQNPIGQHVLLPVWDTGQQDAEVVGVVGDVRYDGVDQPAQSDVYVSFRQYPESGNIVVRTAGDPMSLAPAVRRAVHALDKDLPVFNVKTMDQQLADATSRARFSAVLLGAFAGLALLLASLGIYGVVASSVAARTREIGIRIALGANSRDVRKLVVGDGLLLCMAGVLLGIPAALAATRVLTSFLYGTTPGQPVTYIVVSVLLMLVAALASYIPARRATKVDPLVALRYE